MSSPSEELLDTTGPSGESKPAISAPVYAESAAPMTMMFLSLTGSGTASPWPATAQFPPRALVFDLLNNPPHTRLMLQARQAGLRAVNGWNMLVYQGAAAFEKWTGRVPPVDVMKQALEQSLKDE